MRIIAFGLILVAAPLLNACTSSGRNVSVMTSDVVAVQPGSTFAWAPSPVTSNQDPRVANDIIDQRLRLAVEQALAAKGFRRVTDPASATLTVAYFVAVRDRQETHVDALGDTGFRWTFYGPPQFDAHTTNITEGGLIIDLTDRASGRLAWRAATRKRVHPGDGAQEALNATVRDLTASLPSTAR